MFVRMAEWKRRQRFSRILHFIGEDKYWRLFFHQTSEPYVHKMHIQLPLNTVNIFHSTCCF